MPRIKTSENQKIVKDFIESGERLFNKLKKLLTACGTPLLGARCKRTGKPKISESDQEAKTVVN